MAYCTPSDISRFLYRNTQEFSSNTLLSSTDLQVIIQRKSDLADRVTKRSWATGGTAVTNELCDVVFSDKWRWHGDYVCMFTTQRRPIVSVQKIEVVQGGSYVDITGENPNDRTQGWYNDPATGEHFLVGTDMPGVLRRGARIAYTWGENVSPPGPVVDAVIRLVAAEIMQSENFSIQLPEDSMVGGTVPGKINQWIKDAYEFLRWETDPVVVTEG